MANSLGIDPKKFKHVKSDDKSTTLQHKDGHTLTIAHNVLNPKMKEQLLALAKVPKEEPKKMAEGGEAPRWDSYTGPTPNSKPVSSDFHDKTTTEQDNQRQATRNSQDEALRKSHPSPSAQEPKEDNSGYTDYAKGGDVSCSGNKQGISTQGEIVRNKESKSQAKAEASGRADMERHVKPKMKGLAEGGEVDKKDEEEQKIPKEAVQAADQAPAEQIAPNVPDQAAAPLQADQQQVPSTAAPTPDQAPTEAAGQSPQDPAAQAGIVPQLTPEQQQQAVGAEDAASKVEPAPPPEPMTPVQANKTALDQENMAWAQDLASGHITPKTYGSLFHDKSTAGKIGMIFGMILSGIGSGMSHQPNALLAMMDKQISNDLEAQKTSKSNAQNFLRINQARLLNDAHIKQIESGIPATAAQAKLTEAEANTKAFALAQGQMLQSSYHTMVSNVAKMPEGPAKEAAKQQLAVMQGLIGQKINNINDQAAGASAYYNMLFGQSGANNPTKGNDEQAFQQRVQGMRMLGPQGESRAQDMESKHFPGLQGQASRPLDGGDHSYLQSGIGFQNQMDKFIDWTKKHSGDLNPKDIKTGRAMAADLQGAYRQATHGGVYKEGEQNFISKLIDEDPTKFFNSIRVLPSLKAISSDNKNRLDSYSKNLGFSGFKPQQSSGPQEGQTGLHNGKPVVFTNGAWKYK